MFVEPAPIPEEELQRTYEWMVSWNLIDPGYTFQDLVHADVQRQAHQVSAADND